MTAADKDSLPTTGPNATCWCGCGDRIPVGRRVDSRYIDDTHKKRAYEARHGIPRGGTIREAQLIEQIRGRTALGGLAGALARTLRRVEGPELIGMSLRWEFGDWSFWVHEPVLDGEVLWRVGHRQWPDYYEVPLVEHWHFGPFELRWIRGF